MVPGSAGAKPDAVPERVLVAPPAVNVAVCPSMFPATVKIAAIVQVSSGASSWEARVSPVREKSDALGPDRLRAGTVPANVPTLRNRKVRVCVADGPDGAVIAKVPAGSASEVQKATKPPIAPDRGRMGLVRRPHDQLRRRLAEVVRCLRRHLHRAGLPRRQGLDAAVGDDAEGAGRRADQARRAGQVRRGRPADVGQHDRLRRPLEGGFGRGQDVVARRRPDQARSAAKPDAVPGGGRPTETPPAAAVGVAPKAPFVVREARTWIVQASPGSGTPAQPAAFPPEGTRVRSRNRKDRRRRGAYAALVAQRQRPPRRKGRRQRGRR